MKDLYTKYVYVVDTETKQVIDTADDAVYMKRRIAKKAKANNPYPDSCVFVQANIASPLIQLTTDELIGYHMITNALRAGIVNGVDAKTVMQRLEEANLVRTVNFENTKAIGF